MFGSYIYFHCRSNVFVSLDVDISFLRESEYIKQCPYIRFRNHIFMLFFLLLIPLIVVALLNPLEYHLAVLRVGG